MELERESGRCRTQGHLGRLAIAPSGAAEALVHVDLERKLERLLAAGLVFPSLSGAVQTGLGHSGSSREEKERCQDGLQHVVLQTVWTTEATRWPLCGRP
jgi:hypothetical protein